MENATEQLVAGLDALERSIRARDRPIVTAAVEETSLVPAHAVPSRRTLLAQAKRDAAAKRAQSDPDVTRIQALAAAHGLPVAKPVAEIPARRISISQAAPLVQPPGPNPKPNATLEGADAFYARSDDIEARAFRKLSRAAADELSARLSVSAPVSRRASLASETASPAPSRRSSLASTADAARLAAPTASSLAKRRDSAVSTASAPSPASRRSSVSGTPKPAQITWFRDFAQP